MPIPRIDDIRPRPRHGAGSRLWAEWCFARICFEHLRWRILVLALILLTGTVLFMKLEPSRRHTPVEAAYLTWNLAFGEKPEDFPKLAAELGLPTDATSTQLLDALGEQYSGSAAMGVDDMLERSGADVSKWSRVGE